jgi:hypothetical protein
MPKKTPAAEPPGELALRPGPRRKQPRRGDVLRELAAPPRRIWEDWTLRGHPPDGAFMRWLEGRFSPAERYTIARRLLRCSDYEAAVQLLQLRLEPKIRRLAARTVG